MNLNVVLALLYRDWLTFTRAKYRLVETFYFPIITVLMWGMFSIFMKNFSLEAGLIVLVMNVFWNFAYTSQSTTNMSMAEDIWSGSLKQLFISGIGKTEFIVARIIFSIIVSLFLMVIMFLIAYYVFDLSLFITHFGSISLLITITLISSLALSVFVAAFILATSREYVFLSWTILQIFILLSAPFYTVDILPTPLQYVAGIMPYTDVFESARNLIITNSIDSSLIVRGFVVSLSYFLISFPIYYFSFNTARKNGNIVKMG